ncbi:hypothetical protein DLD77_02300 [Chitinophaga alhagiae]|uniref:Peptidase S74 domain-containing protein n=2 Tax=Chitinophaga alhagiae TaxID=2203219 RepID=A0ABM6W9K5_9BACT|nr:hypothetical protein DLD77_02300 [Chitinophaga alhagiae]
MGENNMNFYLKQYSSNNKFLQESIYDGGVYHVVAEKHKSYINFRNSAGIGNVTPVATLDVNGSIRANTAFMMLGPGSYVGTRFIDGLTSGRRGLHIDNDASTSWEFLSLRNANGEHLRIKGNGYTGLGVDPSYRLHVMQKDGSFAEGIGLTNGSVTWNIVSDGYGARLLISQNGDPSKGLSILNGNTGIGMDAPAAYRLAVNGTVAAKKVKVTQTPWADFVFDPGYDLMPLPELEEYIQQNKHLPGIPTAKEVGKDGVDLAEINAKLLQKIEELTLHLIEQNKEIKQIRKELAAAKAVTE